MKVKEFIKNFWEVLNRREMLILPGHLAFSFILSIVPILTLIGYGAAVLNLSIGFIEEFITKAFGSTISQMIIPIVSVSGLSFSFFVTLFIGFFTASSGASAIIITSNMIYGIEDKGYIYRKIKALVMTVFIVFLFLFILIFPLFGNKIVELVTYVNLNAKVTEELKKIFELAKESKSDVYVAIIMPGQDDYEYIINKNKSIDNKLEYYCKAYDENCVHCMNNQIKIVDAGMINFYMGD